VRLRIRVGFHGIEVRIAPPLCVIDNLRPVETPESTNRSTSQSRYVSKMPAQGGIE